MTQPRVDVAVLGGGLAGNLLCRQLRRQIPDASVALFERDRERAYKVGESTVEIATDYLVRRVGLGTYLYREHLPKYGLRYFFDTEARDGALTRMSELGAFGPPPYPSFQLDRAKLEADLLRMNADDGVDVRVGARVSDLRLADASTVGHRFTVQEDGAEQAWTARFVVDATGRGGIIAPSLSLRVREERHRIAAAWGRFAGVVDIDTVDGDGFRKRARYTSRVLSTNHFMYDGYWIWLIPLRSGLTSVGVVGQADGWDASRHRVEGFLSFVREHRALGELLSDVEAVDMMAYTQLAFRTTQFFSDARWSLVGDAACFTDPFYSPGSDFIALENDLTADLIARDLAGEDLGERVATYDRFMRARYDETLAIYDGLYETFGCYPLYRAKLFFDCGTYYNHFFDQYAADEHLDLKKVKRDLRRRAIRRASIDEVQRTFVAAARELKAKGRYHAHNLGEHELDPYASYGIIDRIGDGRGLGEVQGRLGEILDITKQRLLEVLGRDSDVARGLAASKTYDLLATLGLKSLAG